MTALPRTCPSFCCCDIEQKPGRHGRELKQQMLGALLGSRLQHGVLGARLLLLPPPCRQVLLLTGQGGLHLLHRNRF